MITVTAGIVAGSLWLLDKLELAPHGPVRTRLASIAALAVVLVMLAHRDGFEAGLDWIVDYETNEILDQIQRALATVDH